LGGNDRIIGSAGNDTLDGGDGFDTVDFSEFGAPITLLTGGAFNSGDSGVLIQAERIIGATSQPNTLDAQDVLGNIAFDIDLSQRSLSIVNAPPEIGPLNFEVRNFANVNGSPNSDSIIGGNENNTLNGLDGDDFLDGRSGNDFLNGGSGNDVLLGGNDNDVLIGESGFNFLDGGSGNDQLFTSDGNDTLLGGNDNDLLVAGSGNDSLEGGSGSDNLFGESGDDTLLGGNDNDTLDGGSGNDLLTGGAGSDVFVLTAGFGTDTITDFGRDNDSISLAGGVSFNDLSFAGSDIIFGAETLATLNGFDATTLTESDFV
ncbi:MAG: calcium-binding protein, partial [Cyanobacteria bacterium J06635_13]